MGEHSQASRISSQGVVALANMGQSCRQLGERVLGDWRGYFQSLASTLSRYLGKVDPAEAIELTAVEILIFRQLSTGFQKVPTSSLLGGCIRLTDESVKALRSFADLFSQDPFLPPWNSQGIREATMELGNIPISSPMDDGRSIVECLVLVDQLRLVGQAFEVAAQEMEQELSGK